jgi:hypothetical protein
MTRPYAGQVSIVRQIYGADAASTMTRDEISAAYREYDRRENAASEDRCQDCDPVRVPAEFLVEAWTDTKNMGEWVLCRRHADAREKTCARDGLHSERSAWGDAPA